MKGLIIVCTVLVQEQNLGQLLARWRHGAAPNAPVLPGPADAVRPRGATTTAIPREDLDEAS
jgi:simple sugar transport system permease protein